MDPRGGRVTFATWTDEWKRTVVHLRPTTQRIYDVNLRNHILPELGDIELGKLTPSMFRGWLGTHDKGWRGHGKPLAPASVAQAYRTLNRVLSAAVAHEVLRRNPLQGVKPPGVDTKPMRFLSHKEVAALASCIEPRYRALVRLAAYTGLRAGELVALRRKHVDLLHRNVVVVEQAHSISGCFVVGPPKSAASRRSIALPGIVAEALDEHLAVYSEPGAESLVFSAPEGGYVRIENFRRRARNPAIKAAGVAPLRLHDLRHTCASLAIAAGADVKVLQHMLGHASAALTLDRYGHLFPGQAQSVATLLDKMAREATADKSRTGSGDRKPA